MEVVSLTSRRSAAPARAQSPRRRLMRFRLPGTVIIEIRDQKCSGRGTGRLSCSHQPGFRPRSSLNSREMSGSLTIRMFHGPLRFRLCGAILLSFSLPQWVSMQSLLGIRCVSAYQPSRGSTEAGPWFGTWMLQGPNLPFRLSVSQAGEGHKLFLS